MCVPLFVTEIANKELVDVFSEKKIKIKLKFRIYRIRGFLGLMGPLIVTVGILMAYICGAFVDYRSVPYCFIGFPVLYFVVMLFTPETPHKLIGQNNIQESIEYFV